MARWHKIGLVILGATVLSTVAIQASDLMRGVGGNMAGLLTDSELGCGEGEVQVNLSMGVFCVDKYEAAPAEGCLYSSPSNVQQTQDNLNDPKCEVVSTEKMSPWRFVSLVQAQQLCARTGKRLPTNAEWYALALGQVEVKNCVLNDNSPQLTGTNSCQTVSGISDLVGNVWEWIDAQVIEGQYEQRSLPESGYVSLVDQNGIVLETESTPQVDYGEDYAKTNDSGIYGIIRGGFYGSKSDGGIFAQNLSVALDLKTDGVGFRCLRNLN